jgi:hypothetical protein
MTVMTKAELQAESLPGLVELIHLEVRRGRGPRSRACLSAMVDELARRFGLPELNVLTARLATRARRRAA